MSELKPIDLDSPMSSGPYQGPPPEVISHPLIADAVGGYLKARAEARAARQDVTELEHQLPNAEQADKEALADAIAAGRRDPGTKHADAHRAKIEQARRTAEAYTVIEQRRLADLQPVLDQGQEEWFAQATDDVRRLEAERISAIKMLAEVNNRLDHARSVWNFARGGRYHALDVFKTQAGERTTVSVIGELLDHAKQPWPKTPRRPRFTGGPMIASHG
ncbi:hypothetical protein [Conexibacter arvalis]|uniref:Uncharacterized protein n=1 Tax=Conexibacter arvalis TaxID=912552 RepID=A0A840IGG3_9ACTN|nr:hypothetical protein [Conexibacter arvalis]MBB4663164.1 hypothetical protein [Conexibacter arvalis]